jgi:Tetraspanin family
MVSCSGYSGFSLHKKTLNHLRNDGFVPRYNVPRFIEKITIARLLCFEMTSQTTMAMAVFHYGKVPVVHEAVDNVQEDLRCCGNANFQEWFRVPWSNDSWVLASDKLAVPSSCCDREKAAQLQSRTCLQFVDSSVDALQLMPYERGCADQINTVYR